MMGSITEKSGSDWLKEKPAGYTGLTSSQQTYVAKEELALIEKLTRHGIAVRKT